jgi:hypothetical protein
MRNAVIAFALAFSAAPAFAEPAEDAPTCAIERPVNARLVADAQDLKGVSTRADMLIGNLSYMREPEAEAEAASGAVLFIKRADGWKAIMPSNWENDVGLYSADNGRKMVVIAQRQIEGPGQSFTVMHTGDDFASRMCTELPFPDELNKPTWNMEFLEPHDFDIAASGRGALVAYAALERNGERPRHLWFSYETRDGGSTWRKVKRVGPNAHPPAGLYTPMERKDAPELVADLQAWAKDR